MAFRLSAYESAYDDEVRLDSSIRRQSHGVITHALGVWTRLVRLTSLDWVLATGATSDSTWNQYRYHRLASAR
jgi:hypothetical protein